MVQQKEAKSAAIICAIVIILMSFTYVPDWTVIGVAKDCPLAARFVYPFFHANPLHALINVWCLLSIVFIYDISSWRLLTAYIVAVAVPSFLLSDVPTVGLSCACWFLLGSLMFQVRRKLWFLSCMALYIAVGSLFPAVNTQIHIYGFAAGILFALLNTPIKYLKLNS